MLALIEDRRYILVPVEDVTQEMINACIQDTVDSLETVQLKNNDTIYAKLKWRGDKPSSLWDNYPVRTKEEMVSYLSTNQKPEQWL